MDKGGLDGRSGCSQTDSIPITYLQKDDGTFHKNRRGSQFRRTIVCSDRIWSKLNMVSKKMYRVAKHTGVYSIRIVM